MCLYRSVGSQVFGLAGGEYNRSTRDSVLIVQVLGLEPDREKEAPKGEISAGIYRA